MNDSFDKGAIVEEWIDRRFFRPLGLGVARSLFPTRVTPDQVTLLSLAVGLMAGRLCFYRSHRLNALGVVLFIVSDIFDSADGQLARMRGTSTRFGRILDGVSDNFRFINLYLHLIARMVMVGTAWWIALPLGVAGGLAHGWQSTAADYVRQAYLRIVEGRGELDLPEDVEEELSSERWWKRWNRAAYRAYVRRQARLFPATTDLVRQLRTEPNHASVSAAWETECAGVVRHVAWIGQNIRFLLIALLVVPGWPQLFFWVSLVPMSLIMIALVTQQERQALRHLHRIPTSFAAAT